MEQILNQQNLKQTKVTELMEEIHELNKKVFEQNFAVKVGEQKYHEEKLELSSEIRILQKNLDSLQNEFDEQQLQQAQLVQDYENKISELNKATLESSSLQNQQRLAFEIDFNKLKSTYEKEEQRLLRQLEEKSQEIQRLKKSLESQEQRLSQVEKNTKENKELNHQERNEMREAKKELIQKDSQIQTLMINNENLALSMTETDKQNQILKKRLEQITSHYEGLIE